MEEEWPCPDCGKAIDKFGQCHALSGRVASGAIENHNSIVDGIAAQLRKSHISGGTEPMQNNENDWGYFYF